MVEIFPGVFEILMLVAFVGIIAYAIVRAVFFTS
jgi:hypothetical protein